MRSLIKKVRERKSSSIRRSEEKTLISIKRLSDERNNDKPNIVRNGILPSVVQGKNSGTGTGSSRNSAINFHQEGKLTEYYDKKMDKISARKFEKLPPNDIYGDFDSINNKKLREFSKRKSRIDESVTQSIEKIAGDEDANGEDSESDSDSNLIDSDDEEVEAQSKFSAISLYGVTEEEDLDAYTYASEEKEKDDDEQDEEESYEKPDSIMGRLQEHCADIFDEAQNTFERFGTLEERIDGIISHFTTEPAQVEIASNIVYYAVVFCIFMVKLVLSTFFYVCALNIKYGPVVLEATVSAFNSAKQHLTSIYNGEVDSEEATEIVKEIIAEKKVAFADSFKELSESQFLQSKEVRAVLDSEYWGIVGDIVVNLLTTATVGSIQVLKVVVSSLNDSSEKSKALKKAKRSSRRFSLKKKERNRSSRVSN
mmetsp:Transcript_11468/g.14271  ORF Transcript_11468/g.14271 Transcript_11468/m.14271 type:complete len:426 (-) Transcript_11468:173-1450(-)